jgi:hypothetical protein
MGAATGPPAGDRPEVVDSGSFTLYLEGARIGEERFIIRRERAGSAGSVYRAGAELNLKLDGSTMRIGVALEVTRPRSTAPQRQRSSARYLVTGSGSMWNRRSAMR